MDDTKQAIAMNPINDINMAEIGAENIKDCVCQMIHIINYAMGSRGRSPWKAKNGHFELEEERLVFGEWRPRFSYNTITDKSHRTRESVRTSEAGTLEKIVECVCVGGHKNDNKLCFMTVVLKWMTVYKKTSWKEF